MFKQHSMSLWNHALEMEYATILMEFAPALDVILLEMGLGIKTIEVTVVFKTEFNRQK